MPCSTDQMNGDEVLYPIREVAELTGIKPVTLRAWQRRYHILQPIRSEKGHRLYRQQDVERIQQIQRWLQQGVSIRRVKFLLESNSQPDGVAHPLEQVEMILDSLARLDNGKLNRIMLALFQEYPFDVIWHQCIEPVFAAIDLLKNTHKQLQKGLFRSALFTRFVTTIEINNKSARRNPVFIAHLQGSDGLLAWSEGVRYSELGYGVTMVEQVDDLSPLLAEWVVDRNSVLVISGSRPLNDKQREWIKHLVERDIDVKLTNALALLEQRNSAAEHPA